LLRKVSVPPLRDLSVAPERKDAKKEALNRMGSARLGHAPGGPLGSAAAAHGSSALDGTASGYLAALTQRM
jgi:hypothetical protein